MAKKPYLDDFNDDDDHDDDWMVDEPIPLDGDQVEDLTELDVRELCGAKNAARGKELFASGAVAQRSFDGSALHATVNDGALLPVVLDLNDGSNACSDAKHARIHDPGCEHIAALMYAYIEDPGSFFPQTMGEYVQLLEKNPTLREQSGAEDPQVAALVETLKNAPPEARAAFEQLPMNPTPQDLARIAPQMQMLAQTQARTQLVSLLQALTTEQLRALARRRGWKLDGTAKTGMIAQLARELEAAPTPAPAEYSPDENTLLSLLNTLDGVTRDHERGWLERLWGKRVNDDMRRLNLALEGLQSAGVLFPDRPAGKIHYHWSPFVHSDDLPLFVPNVKPYPPDRLERAQIAEPTPSLPALVDAVLAFAEHAPLGARVRSRDPKLDHSPDIGAWDYEPQEVEPLLKGQYLYTDALTIPLASLWTDETLETFETIASGSRELGTLAAGLALQLGLLKDAGEGHVVVDAEKLNGWRGFTPEEQQAALWNLWRTGGVGYSDLRIASARASLRVQRSTHVETFTQATLIQEIALARQFIVRLLGPLDAATWYSWKAFAEYTRDLRPDFLHTFTNQNVWFFIAAKTRHRYQAHNPAHWESAYRPVLAAMLEGALHWFGAVELAYENQALVAFRITPLGAWFLSGGRAGTVAMAASPAAGEEPAGEAIRWLDDTTCRLRPSPDTARVLPLVRAIADPTRETLTFRITNTTLARAFERGITPREIADQFASLDAPLPDALRERVDALYANYGRVHLYDGLTLLELADDFALRELLAGTSLANAIVHQFSPRVIVVRDQDVDALVAEMVKKGYTPRVTGDVK